MPELSDKTWAKIDALCLRGNELMDQGKFSTALDRYSAALKLIPPPATNWEAGVFLYSSMGDAYFNSEEFAHAAECLELAVQCPGGVGNPFVHLRLGQCRLELGKSDAAADELMRAFMGAGQEIFDDEDPKYFKFLKTRAEI
ncbi:tetratricopeptide repeat protein [Rubinisphaera margarita]|uniref:tetratricopeptide repeat protein n=1 Tax=Rubinisphaera margarita TaxID=2909586 RepID=UPI001EE8607B|nr:hypothetical protein [Rubinisphaera margarita]MCG6158493.1 hypothetical protein [Rubinisphaera margarita]